MALQRDQVLLREFPDVRGFWGILYVRRGLKRAARKRELPITEKMAAVLRNLLTESKCAHVFTCLEDHSQPLSRNTLADQHRRVMKTCDFHPDSGLHALRHTFLTEAGRHTQNVRVLQKLAGHSRIETTMKYIHPDQDDAFAIAANVQQARKPEAVPTIFTTTNQGNASIVRKM